MTTDNIPAEKKVIHVNVELTRNRGYEWIQVMAFDLDDAFTVAAKNTFVYRVLETSYIPGGVVI